MKVQQQQQGGCRRVGARVRVCVRPSTRLVCISVLVCAWVSVC